MDAQTARRMVRELLAEDEQVRVAARCTVRPTPAERARRRKRTAVAAAASLVTAVFGVVLVTRNAVTSAMVVLTDRQLLIVDAATRRSKAGRRRRVLLTGPIDVYLAEHARRGLANTVTFGRRGDADPTVVLGFGLRSSDARAVANCLHSDRAVGGS